MRRCSLSARGRSAKECCRCTCRFPARGGTGVSGLIGLLSETLYDYSSGTRDASPVSAESDVERMAPERDTLIEGIITESEDETLMERYLSGETVATEVLISDLLTAVARGSFYPVLAVSSPLGIGMAELLEIVTLAFPSPLAHPLPPVTSAATGDPVEGLSCDPDGPLLAEVVKTTSDPYVGRISLVRVFSGTLRADMSVHVSGHGRAARGHPDHDDDERVGALTSPLGKQQRPLTESQAGSICAVAKLSTAETGDTLSSREQPLLMEPWTMPDPLLPVAIVARSKADEDKLSAALGAAGRRGPDHAAGDERGDPPARALVHGRGPRGRAAGPAVVAVRRRGGHGDAAGAAARDGGRCPRAGSGGT